MIKYYCDFCGQELMWAMTAYEKRIADSEGVMVSIEVKASDTSKMICAECSEEVISKTKLG